MAGGVLTTEWMMSEVSGVSRCGGVKKIMFLCPAREGFVTPVPRRPATKTECWPRSRRR